MSGIIDIGIALIGLFLFVVGSAVGSLFYLLTRSKILLGACIGVSAIASGLFVWRNLGY